MDSHYILYSDKRSGGVAVEAALTLMGQHYDLVEAPTSEPEDAAGGDRVLAANPMRQVPALVLPGGEIMTESAAILIRLGELHPQAGLAPGPDDPRRAAFLRWMAFVSAAIYSLYWVKDDPARLAPDPAAQPALVARSLARISECWGIMERQAAPGRYILGDELTVLDLYVTVVSRFNPRRRRFYDVAPRLGEVVRRVDDDPRLAAFWADRYPFEPGWDRPD
ncbi:MAG TPA: glutathione S-transferase family protein [Phenylobacterium sp.]